MENKEVKKYVITGGPSSRKTSLINELEKKGFNTLNESAREILESVPKERASNEETQLKIWELQRMKESRLERGVWFLDRGVIDTLAYLKLNKYGYSQEIYKASLEHKYDRVFLLEPFHFENDGLRVEKNEEEAKKSHEEIKGIYKELGYNLVNVPVMEVEERVNYILNKINFEEK